MWINMNQYVWFVDETDLTYLTCRLTWIKMFDMYIKMIYNVWYVD